MLPGKGTGYNFLQGPGRENSRIFRLAAGVVLLDVRHVGDHEIAFYAENDLQIEAVAPAKVHDSTARRRASATHLRDTFHAGWQTDRHLDRATAAGVLDDHHGVLGWIASVELFGR